MRLATHALYVAARAVAGEQGWRVPRFGWRPPLGSVSHVSSVDDGKSAFQVSRFEIIRNLCMLDTFSAATYSTRHFR